MIFHTLGHCSVGGTRLGDFQRRWVSGEFRGVSRGSLELPSGPKLFHFHREFKEICLKLGKRTPHFCIWTPSWEILDPPLWVQLKKLPIFWVDQFLIFRECGGVVVECRTPNREVLSSIPTGVTVLCPWARHINSLQYWLNPGRVGSVPTWLKNWWLGR